MRLDFQTREFVIVNVEVLVLVERIENPTTIQQVLVSVNFLAFHPKYWLSEFTNNTFNIKAQLQSFQTLKIKNYWKLVERIVESFRDEQFRTGTFKTNQPGEHSAWKYIVPNAMSNHTSLQLSQAYQITKHSTLSTIVFRLNHQKT